MIESSGKITFFENIDLQNMNDSQKELIGTIEGYVQSKVNAAVSELEEKTEKREERIEKKIERLEKQVAKKSTSSNR